MSSEENKRIALSIIEALNARDLSLWSKHLAEDYIADARSSRGRSRPHPLDGERNP